MGLVRLAHRTYKGPCAQPCRRWRDSLVLYADVEKYAPDASAAFTKRCGSSLQYWPLGAGGDEAP
jgi:hypothetical protein